MQAILNEKDYLEVMEKVESMLQKSTLAGGFSALGKEDRDDLRRLSLMAEAWEDSRPIMPLKRPETLIEMIEWRMFERKIKQKELADLLEITPSRLSEIMQGKRKVNLELAKRLWKRLEIEPKFILEAA